MTPRKKQVTARPFAKDELLTRECTRLEIEIARLTERLAAARDELARERGLAALKREGLLQ